MIKKLLFTIIAILFVVQNGWTAFNEIGVGARPIGMGDAFVAIADDGNAVNYNVGAIGRIDDIQIGLTKSMLFAGLVNYNHVGLILPIGKIGTLGASFGQLTEDSGIYGEKELIFSYGKSVLSFARNTALSSKTNSIFSTGISLKYLATNYDETIDAIADNPYFAKTSANALSINWGVLIQPATGLSVGFSADNLLPADVSISEDEEDRVPIKLGLGLAYNLDAIASGAQQKSMQELLSRTQCAFEVDLRDGVLGIHTGVEIGVYEAFTLRGGYSTKSSVNSSSIIAFGASAILPIKSVRVRLDYAFQMLMGDLQDKTFHRISTNLIF